MNADLRASDADRQQVIDALGRHTAMGRLTLDEFAARVDAAARSKTAGELAAVTADLPTAPAPTHAVNRGLVVAAVVLAVVLVALIGLALLAAFAGGPHMGGMMSSMGCR